MANLDNTGFSGFTENLRITLALYGAVTTQEQCREVHNFAIALRIKSRVVDLQARTATMFTEINGVRMCRRAGLGTFNATRSRPS